MPTPIPTSSFDTDPDYFGIPRRTIFTAVAMALPLIYVYYVFLTGLVFLLATAATLYYIFIPLAEYLIEVVPPKFLQHNIDWVRAGSTLFVTSDSKPVPLSVPDARKKR